MSTNTSATEVLVVLGTRPEAIKLAGVIRALGPRARVVHTGQHYDASMWSNVLGDLAGVQVDEHIEIGGRTRGEQIGLATTELTRHLLQRPARAVVVQGDTNSTLAGALAASSTGTPIVHVEAGLRSHDRAMPEEVNRVLVDAIAELCCAPLAANADQLASEGVDANRVVVTGNTLADALDALVPSASELEAMLAAQGLQRDDYVLSTIHRAGTVDDRARLERVLTGLAELAREVTVVLPLHPHTRKNVELWNLQPLLADVRVVEPLPPREFMGLESAAALLVSDSGGVQEEACLFRRPLVVLRDSTERPELLDGWCRLLGDADPVAVLRQAWADVPAWSTDLATRELPYPLDSASQRIVAEIDRRWPAS